MGWHGFRTANDVGIMDRPERLSVGETDTHRILPASSGYGVFKVGGNGTECGKPAGRENGQWLYPAGFASERSGDFQLDRGPVD
jgi:hypothetical protein